MLIFSKTRFISLLLNVITTDVKDNVGYIYIHRDTYDEAVTISANYYCKDVIKALGRENNIDVIHELEPYVDEKLRVLLGYLVLLEEDMFKDKETIEDKLELAIGAIHRMSITIDLSSLLDVPVEVRKKIKFSQSIQDEYRLSWDKFFKESLTYDEIVGALKENTLVPQVQYVIPLYGNVPGQSMQQEESNVDEFGLEDNSEELEEVAKDISGGDPNFDWDAYYTKLANDAGYTLDINADGKLNTETKTDIVSESEVGTEVGTEVKEQEVKRKVILT